MNIEIILKMVKPYLNEKTITYNEFDCIFSFLSRKEQYVVADILDKNGISLRDEIEPEDIDITDFVYNNEMIKLDGVLEHESKTNNKIRILHDENIFNDVKKEKDEHLIIYKNIKQSNEVLCKLIQKGDKQAKQDLCVKNKGLVDKYAVFYEKYYGNHLLFEDLEQAGMIGLIKAAEKFDFNQGTVFSTYAVFWIRQSIVREIFDNGFAIRLPAHLMECIVKITRLDNDYAIKEYNFNDRMQAISKDLNFSVDFIEYCLCLRQNYLAYSSLNIPIGEAQETELQDMLDSKEVSVEDIIATNILHDMLVQVMESLSEREQKVLRLRFGLEDGRAWTLEEIGKDFNVTRERIRQIEEKALQKLRHPTRICKLKDFL